MATNVDIEGSQLQLESINCEISDIKYCLLSILSKVEFQISLFVSFKAKLPSSEVYQDDINSLDKFFNDINQEVLTTDTKVSMLIEKTNYLSQLFEESQMLKSDALEQVKLEPEQLNCLEESNLAKNEACILEMDSYEKDYQSTDEEKGTFMESKHAYRKPKQRLLKKCRQKRKPTLKIYVDGKDDEALMIPPVPKKSKCSKSTGITKKLKKLQHSIPKQSKFGKLTCQLCFETFANRGCYLEHRQGHTVAELSSLSPNILESEIAIDLSCDKEYSPNGSFTYKCKICEKTFYPKSNADRHLISHTHEKPYRCDICGLCYRDEPHLRKHYNVIHPEEAGLTTFSCPRRGCKERFDTQTALIEHKQTHTGEKPNQCVTCGKFFSDSGIMQHVCPAKAGDEKSFTCDICMGKYYTSFQLRVHIRKVHCVMKSYVCEICGNAYKQKGSLDEHRRGHTGEKPYECSICKKRFRNTKNLKEHSNMHTGKRYSCQVCGSTYSYKKGLKLHIKKGCSRFNSLAAGSKSTFTAPEVTDNVKDDLFNSTSANKTNTGSINEGSHTLENAKFYSLVASKSVACVSDARRSDCYNSSTTNRSRSVINSSGSQSSTSSAEFSNIVKSVTTDLLGLYY